MTDRYAEYVKNENDLELIKKAKDTPSYLWWDVLALKDQAETPEGKEILHSIGMHMYHREESFAGML